MILSILLFMELIHPSNPNPIGWEALSQKNYVQARAEVDTCLARTMEDAIVLQNDGIKQEYRDQMALNMAGECMYLSGRIYEEEGEIQRAIDEYKKLIALFPDAWVFNVNESMWNPAAAAEERLNEIHAEMGLNTRTEKK